MTKEQHRPSPEGFDFTENEKLFYKVNNERLMEIIFDDKTTIHKANIDSNNYGEYLFLTTSRATAEGRECVSFWGFGFHEYRDRWLTNEWFWYRANQFPELMRQELAREEVEELIKTRLQEIAPYITDSKQSQRGQLFEMLAEMTDEDGAYSALDELEEWLDDL
jgi:hypothetical protein